ncbi:hypothetical protein [Tropicibacter oceani]|uniref:Uncharacterized protein n=1 Tax=Tropicibacter oceani TaxID=3058420 RepID=A0ABY8QNQ6_9RHOB|nr:hypothetical protein [Tropicibacter oceani]WGW05583.1 hypothetical protein QF118_08555 [Tropicibacter oceani]
MTDKSTPSKGTVKPTDKGITLDNGLKKGAQVDLGKAATTKK